MARSVRVPEKEDRRLRRADRKTCDAEHKVNEEHDSRPQMMLIAGALGT
ncbi:MAG: hypothetical protein LLG00_06865 [Planctomycetaceae bacterium]|nr:hypothetical protein [Planctomycetaceae bacterium]